MLHFVHHLCLFGRYNRRQVADFLPDIVLDQFNYLGTNGK